MEMKEFFVEEWEERHSNYLQQDYNVKGKKWIAVLKQMDHIINQKKYYGTFLNP